VDYFYHRTSYVLSLTKRDGDTFLIFFSQTHPVALPRRKLKDSEASVGLTAKLPKFPDFVSPFSNEQGDRIGKKIASKIQFLNFFTAVLKALSDRHWHLLVNPCSSVEIMVRPEV
jgi:hypothetical protein